MEHDILCRHCGSRFDPGVYTNACPECEARGDEGRLEVVYDIDDIDVDALPFGSDTSDSAGTRSMWRYAALLPLLPDEPVSLGEGFTPILDGNRLSEKTGCEVLLKNETTNPTWSFKDRFNSLLVSNLVELGVDRIATSSTGNQGASAAAYCSRGGVDQSVVILPNESEDPIRKQILAYGATAVVTKLEERSKLLGELAEDGWYPSVSKMPYGFEAYKTIAYEMYEQLGDVPDVITFPVGAGDGLYGIWKGFRDLRELGIVEDSPRLIAIQSEERAPIVKSILSGADAVEPDEGPMPITVSNATTSGSDLTLAAVQESGGTGISCSQDEVEAAIRELGRDGFFVEPTTALNAAAVEKAVEQGDVEPSETVVCVLTGAGVKWPQSCESALGTPPTISPDIESLYEVLE